MKKPLIILCFNLFSLFIFCQEAPVIQWQKYYGDAWNDEVHDAIPNMLGGITFTGTSKNQFKTGKNIYLTIIKDNGEIIHEQSIGRRKDDEGNAIIQAYDGGYYIVGYSESPSKGHSGKKDGWLIKVNEMGVPVWDKLFGSREDDVFYDIAVDEQGNLIICGAKNGDIWLLKTDPKGKRIWEETYRSQHFECAKALLISLEGNITLTGFEEDNKSNTLIVMQTNQVGEILWRITEEGKKGFDHDFCGA